MLFSQEWLKNIKIKGLDDVTEKESCFRGGARYCIYMNDYKDDIFGIACTDVYNKTSNIH